LVHETGDHASWDVHRNVAERDTATYLLVSESVSIAGLDSVMIER